MIRQDLWAHNEIGKDFECPRGGHHINGSMKYSQACRNARYTQKVHSGNLMKALGLHKNIVAKVVEFVLEE